jgi:UDP-N-acetylmuramoyl-tripeptide--D-alanyl-D-alanine ligase
MEKLFNHFLSVRKVTTDTRSIEQGSIFFALKGENFNGNQFALQALELGASLAVVDEDVAPGNHRVLVVNDVLKTLQDLSKMYRETFSFPVLGITGSNGKTTTKELVREVLGKKYKVYATKGNLNNHIGVPLTLLAIPVDCNFAIIEMGANHQGEIASYCNYALPDFGVITNIGKAHLEGFGGVDGIIKGKGELYQAVEKRGGVCFANTELPHLPDMVKDKNHLAYGYHTGAIQLRIIEESPVLRVEVTNTITDERRECITQLAGGYNAFNLATAFAIGNYFGVSTTDMVDAVQAYTPENNRSQWWNSGKNQVILDAYNANPSSLEVALKNLATMQHTFFIIGDMFEMGEYAGEEHQRILDLASELELNGVAIGKEFSQCRTDRMCFASAAEAKDYFSSNPIENKIVLLKGSRGMKLEQLKDIL